ncbi:GtrA family protein [Sulfuricystis multivorans]|uniref:GtrA family protein n=1 Tax=Sulfuricystis multivorans TaxID=2211108 RepID=UPI0015586939|nr:GtrA family protein [Sulfuricystis multivorans]
MIDRTLVRFLAVGAGNTALGLAVIFSSRQIFSDVAANLIGYLVVVPISFLAHRDLSFRDRGNRLKAFVRYIPTILTGYCANFAMLTVAMQSGTNPYLAQTAAIACHVLATYIMSRIFVFPSHEERKE